MSWNNFLDAQRRPIDSGPLRAMIRVPFHPLAFVEPAGRLKGGTADKQVDGARPLHHGRSRGPP